jgi:hypothetical protein
LGQKTHIRAIQNGCRLHEKRFCGLLGALSEFPAGQSMNVLGDFSGRLFWFWREDPAMVMTITNRSARTSDMKPAGWLAASLVRALLVWGKGAARPASASQLASLLPPSP